MPATIVVADDDPAILALLTEILTETGYLVHNARNGSEALALLRRYHPALLVTDHQMPGLTGIELLAHMATTPAEAAPTLLISAVHPVPPAPPPPHLFLAKPFDLDTFLTAVTRLLNTDPRRRRQPEGGRWGIALRGHAGKPERSIGDYLGRDERPCWFNREKSGW